MDLAQKKQEFSKAYVKAVAAACGYATQEPSVDEDSVDLGLAARGGGGTVRSPRLDLQLKCTARHLVGDQTVNFPLEMKNYEELRPIDFLVPRILVVVVVPDDVGQWISHSEAKNCFCGIAGIGTPYGECHPRTTPQALLLTYRGRRSSMFPPLTI